MNKTLLIISLVSCFSVLAKEFNLNERLEAKNNYRKTYQYVFGKKDYAHAETFTKLIDDQNIFKRKKIKSFMSEVKSFLPPEFARPLAYWTYIKKEGTNQRYVLQAAQNYLVHIVRDYNSNPYNKKRSKIPLNILPNYSNIVHTQHLGGNEILKMIKKLPAFKIKVPNNSLDQYSLSSLGFIPGNQVEVISKNEVNEDRIKWFNDRVIFAGGKIDFDAPYIKMPTKDDPTGHISFKEDPIFMKIRDMIDDAKESIFIDIFLFGGTFGMTLTEYLLDQTLIKKKKNPNFKVLVLHDYATNYNMGPEILPVFYYLRDRIKNEKALNESVFLLQANIQRHPPGIPFGITNLIPKTDEIFKLIEPKSTYFESKIDHSKVIVIDPNTDSAQAYFGSKNWSDHSGGYYYDDAIWVKGPGAAAVQASYFNDVEAALTEDPLEMSWMYYKDKGLDNAHYLKRKNEILDWFKITKKIYKHQGDEVIRIAEADVDGKVKNVRNIIIDMIRRSESHIYMEQLFVYDPYINEALIKRKKQVPSIQIKILADHNGNFGFNGFPNTMYMKRLAENGIEIKARRTLGIEAHFPDGTTQEYHQENHRKIASFDSFALLGGSSNLNPDTLQGSFREFGAQIFAKKEILEFEQDFLKAWNDENETMDLNIENNQLTVKGKDLSLEHSELLNAFAAQLMRSKDALEERY